MKACIMPADPNGEIATAHFQINGPMIKDNKVPTGTVVQKECKFGYAIATLESRESLCLADGTWTHTLGMCKRRCKKQTLYFFCNLLLIYIFLFLLKPSHVVYRGGSTLLVPKFPF